MIAAAVRVALRVLPVRRTVFLLERLPGRPAPESDADACWTAACQAAARIAHPTCLYRSLVAFALLARRGRRVALHIGAHRGPHVAAHAWVTIDGRALGGDGAERYRVLWRHASGGRR